MKEVANCQNLNKLKKIYRQYTAYIWHSVACMINLAFGTVYNIVNSVGHYINTALLLSNKSIHVCSAPTASKLKQ